jgi:hypothetical protein
MLERSQSGCLVQESAQVKLSGGTEVRIREAFLKAGAADYSLFAPGKAIATVHYTESIYEETRWGLSAKKSITQRRLYGSRLLLRSQLP